MQSSNIQTTSTQATVATALITGALTGIGRATAFAFAAEGYQLVISGRNLALGAKLEAELREKGVKAHFVRADVTNEEQVQALVAQTLTFFGRLDVAVNNAGTEGELGPITEQSVANYYSTFDTNVLGVLLSLKYELLAMQAQGSGAIINLSSIAGIVGMAGASVYVASKHAVEGLTKSAALEVAAMGIRVNAVAPGPIQTPMLDRFTGGNADAKAGMLAMLPAKRSGTPEEIAQTILFLASDKAKFITGQSLAIDGGYLAQ